eukprot:PITA_03741
MAVKEYTEELYWVNLRACYMEDTPEKKIRYVNGLRLEILDEIRILSPRNIEEAYQSAMKVEEKITRQKMLEEDGEPVEEEENPMAKDELPIIVKRAAFPRLQEQQKKETTLGEEGHIREEEEMAEAEGLPISATEEAKAPPQEAENVSKIGEDLVLNKVLLKLANETVEKTQRKALFRTVSKSHGKCCKLIIDSGSTDNLVATEMVEKLVLKWLKHPTPYMVLWLQIGHQLLVDEQCEVKFHIGRYKDRVVCDIMPMDVCHILLGRPWQYDWKVVHDGKTNFYKFVKDGIKHTLVPIKEEETTKTSGKKVLLMGGK